MASLSELRLQDPGYKRYILSLLSLDYLCELLAPYETVKIRKLHADLLYRGYLYLPPCHTAADNYNTVSKCPQSCCSCAVRDLDSEHSKKSVKQTRRNSDITLWHTEPWSLALLYMSPGQDPATNKTPEKTDISGTLGLLINCNRFLADKTVVEEIRDIRNSYVHHSANFSVSAVEFKALIDLILKLLADPDVYGHLIDPYHTKELNQMKQMTFDVSFEGEVKALQGAIRDFQQSIKTINVDIKSNQENIDEVKAKTNTTHEEIKRIKLDIKSNQGTINDVEAKSNTTYEQVITLETKWNEHLQKYPDLYSALSQDVATNKAEIQVLKAKMKGVEAQVQSVEAHVHGVEAHVQGVEAHVQGVEAQVQGMESHVQGVEAHVQGVTEQVGGLDRRLKDVETRPTSGLTVVQLRQRLVKVYSQRPEYQQVSPVLDETVKGSYPMDSVYVELKIEEEDSSPAMTREAKIKGVPISNALDMLPTEGHRVCVEGFPGSGKSFLVTAFARAYSTRANKKDGAQSDHDESLLDRYDLLILLQTRSLDKSVYHTMKFLLYGADNLDVAPEDIQRILTSSSCPPVLLLLDGYDEGTRPQQQIIDDILASKKLPDANVLVTSRPGIIRGKFNKRYRNLGFNEEQQLLFIENFTALQDPERQEHMERFRRRFKQSKELKSLFTAPVMAMATCYMVAHGHHITFESRIDLYQDLVGFMIERACTKSGGAITEEDINNVMPAFQKATFEQLLNNNSYYISREDIESVMSGEQIDTILINIGFISVTKYGYGKKVQSTFTYTHKTVAEFMGAKHILSLPVTEGAEAMRKLFKSGPANQEVIRMALGMCHKEKADRLVPLFANIVGMFEDIVSLLENQQALQQQMEVIKTYIPCDGSHYLLVLLLIEMDTCSYTLPAAVLWELSRVCTAIMAADVEEDTINATMEGEISTELSQVDVSIIDLRSASALYSSLLLAAYLAQGSLHTVRQVDVHLQPCSPHSAATYLPNILAACAPQMTALTLVDVWNLDSATELGGVCGGLVASGAPCLTRLELRGNSNLVNDMSGDLAQLVKVATQLTGLVLDSIHVGEEGQLVALCAAVGEALKLTHLTLRYSGVTAQQYSAVLLPALRGRREAGGVRLQDVTMVVLSHTVENWGRLRAALRKVADMVHIDKL